MNKITRTTRACTLETLDGNLKSAMRAHGEKFGLADLESDISMCCETMTVRQRQGLFGGIKTTLSAVYVTPKWLVWADSIPTRIRWGLRSLCSALTQSAFSAPKRHDGGHRTAASLCPFQGRLAGVLTYT